MTTFYDVGKIVNTQGLKGELRIISVTDFPEERYRKGSLLHVFGAHLPEPLAVTVATHRRHKQFDIVSFEGYGHINAVESWKGGQLKVAAEALQPLEEDSYYYHEIIGLTVKDSQGVPIGQIVEILSPAANDVWVVCPESGNKDILVPFIDDVVKKVDIRQQEVIIERIEGLID